MAGTFEQTTGTAMAKTLVAHEEAVQKIFCDDYVFRIPDYQRPYSWTTEQARELMDDLLTSIESNPGKVAEMPPYFLGSIVLIKGDAPQADVVDGQQRLTTLTILLAAIRATVDPALRTHITKRLYEAGDVLAGTEERFRLTLRERDAEFFQTHVQREGGIEKLVVIQAGLTDSQKNLRDNAMLFLTRLEGLAPEARTELASFILQRCFLVVVATPDEDSAYRIFSVLNSRGLDLSATDILKARIIGAIPEARRESYTKKWEDAEEEIGRDEFNLLFSHIRTIFRKAKAKDSLLKEFELYVSSIKTPIPFVDEVLLPYAEAYADLKAATYSATTLADVVNEHLGWLNRLEFNDWLPPAIVFTSRFRNEPEAMVKFAADLERLSYFMLVTGKGVNDRLERFSKVTAAIELSKNLFEENSPLQLTPPEQLAFFDRLNGPIYDSLSAKALSPVMLRLDRLMSDGGASYNNSILSVEHVMPQHPRQGSKWLTWFPEPGDRAQAVHRLGNLALLSRRKNSQASNWDFDKKKDIYFRRGQVSAFVLTSQVLSTNEWTKDIFERRQAELVGRFVKHWRLDNRLTLDAWIMKSL